MRWFHEKKTRTLSESYHRSVEIVRCIDVITLFWLFRDKVQKLMIYEFQNLTKNSILPLSRHLRDLKTTSVIIYNLYLSSIEHFKVEQISSFSQNCNFLLVPLFVNWPIASKIAVYRRKRPFHVKIQKILLNNHVQQDVKND